ncbi:MAG TPA: hypothetical protein VEB00_06365 [Clostridia bacterium]|nr:hypothetical protein [Clostridia bacterium]
MATKIAYALYKTDTEERNIYYEDLDQDDYDTKYKYNLFCITPGCEAHIKFTERTDGKKFFSTWNKEGSAHKDDCPLFVVYKGSVTRNSVYGSYVNVDISEDRILESLKRKSKDLNTDHSKVNTNSKKKTTRKVKKGGIKTAAGYRYLPGADNVLDDKKQRFRLNSIDANYASAFLGQNKMLYGIIESAKFINDGQYGFINLKVEDKDTYLYLPQAFYAERTNVDDVRRFISIINNEIKKRTLNFLCVGLIEDKNDRVRITVTNPYFVYINDKSYFEIVYSGVINKPPYINI